MELLNSITGTVVAVKIRKGAIVNHAPVESHTIRLFEKNLTMNFGGASVPPS
jgi:hypothetical protein